MNEDDIEVAYPGYATDQKAERIADIIKEYDDIPNHALIQSVSVEAGGRIEVEYFYEEVKNICEFDR